MTDKQQLQTAARAAEQAATVFAERGQTDEWAVSQLMANRYNQQLADREK